MSEPKPERLFKAWAEALTRSQPALDRGVRRRVLTAQARTSHPQAFPLVYRLALAGCALAVALVVTLLLRAPNATTFQVAGHAGEVGAWLTTPTQDLALHFSEGTSVSLGKGSQGRVTRLTRGGARVELANGFVNAEVRHLPGAEWSFGAGPFEVTVTGTKLGVSWSPDRGQFELSVSRGSVLVQGPFIPQPQAVLAGEICRVGLNRHSMALGPLTAQQAAPVAAGPTAALPPGTAPQLAEPALAPPNSSSGVHAASAEALLEDARAARMAGRPDRERAALLACRKRAPGQPPAAQAAYLLGRASAPAEAATWFETYLREMPQGLLAREAAGRLIESYKASGNTAALQNAASRYLTRYPNGPHAAMARRALAAQGESQD